MPIKFHSRPRLTLVLMVLLGSFLPLNAIAAIESDFKMDLSLEASIFTQEGKGEQEDWMGAAQVKPDLALFFNEFSQAVISPRFRLGLSDPEYNLVSPDDIYLEFFSERLEFRAGYQTFFWGTVESFNIVDILNQQDFVGDFMDPEKIGEPALRFRFSLNQDRIDLFYFPYFTPAALPGPVNRFNFFEGALEVSDDEIYSSTLKKRRPQFAFRWERTLGSADLGLSYFNGYEKFPIITLEPGSPEALPFYYEMQQGGFDLQMSLGNWLIKTEAVYQDTGPAGEVFKTAVLPTGTIGVINLVPKDHTAFAGGVEYTFFNLFGNNDLGLILEYLYNSEQDLDALAFRPFQNDLFGGFRLVRNNPGDGELLTGVFYDLNIGSQILRVEYSERFFEKVGVEVAVDLLNADTEDQLFVFNNEDRFTLVLTYTY